jgi:serine acetyltransferase
MGLGLDLLRVFRIEWQINKHIKISNFIYYKIPFFGKFISASLDRFLFIVYGIELMSFSINVNKLSITHPGGILLGGNGVFSKGRVVIMSGVKFGGRSTNDRLYLEKHKSKRVFELGDNVVIGTSSTLLGPITICDNVLIGSMSLVNKSIQEPGVYAGIPVKKISDQISYEWISHL